MATFTARRTTPLANTTGQLASAVNLYLGDPNGTHAYFRPLNPDDTVSTFTTTDAATITWLTGIIAGEATEGITITQTA